MSKRVPEAGETLGDGGHAAGKFGIHRAVLSRLAVGVAVVPGAHASPAGDVTHGF